MNGKHHIIRAAALALLTPLLLVACADPRTYDHFEHTDATSWETGEALVFDVPRQWEGVYTMTFGVRTTVDYPYKNLAVVVETTVLPQRSVRRDTVMCAVSDNLGHPTGQRGISTCEHSAAVCAIRLQENDSLHVSVRHLMQREELPGVSEVGIRLEKQ